MKVTCFPSKKVSFWEKQNFLNACLSICNQAALPVGMENNPATTFVILLVDWNCFFLFFLNFLQNNFRIYPDLVKHLHQQVRPMGNFCRDEGVLWLTNTAGTLCFIYKTEVENLNHFVVNCPNFKDQFESLWSNLDTKIISSNSKDRGAIAEFTRNLKHQERLQWLLGGLVLPFDQPTNALITRFISCVLGKICKVFSTFLRELEAPWLVLRLPFGYCYFSY